MNSKFNITNFDILFSIDTEYSGESLGCIKFGDKNNLLELSRYNDSNRISSIECIYANDILNENFILPDIRNTQNLKKAPFAVSYNKENGNNSFILNFNKNELDIIFNKDLQVYYYYISDRIEYYYDDDFNLLFIKVNNLSEEEYNYFLNMSKSSNIIK